MLCFGSNPTDDVAPDNVTIEVTNASLPEDATVAPSIVSGSGFAVRDRTIGSILLCLLITSLLCVLSYRGGRFMTGFVLDIMDGKYGPTKPFKVHDEMMFVSSVKDHDPLSGTLCLKFQNPPLEHKNKSKFVLSMYLPTKTNKSKSVLSMFLPAKTEERLEIPRTELDDEVC
eukprot:213237_1